MATNARPINFEVSDPRCVYSVLHVHCTILQDQFPD